MDSEREDKKKNKNRKTRRILNKGLLGEEGKPLNWQENGLFCLLPKKEKKNQSPQKIKKEGLKTPFAC